MMRKKIVSLCMALTLCLSLLPATALAAEGPVYGTIQVGGKELTNSANAPVVYATTDEDGVVTIEGATAVNYNVMWNGTTLTLRNATVNATRTDGATTYHYNAAIYYTGSNDIAIELMGTNNLSGQKSITDISAAGICLIASSLTIGGSGVLNITFPENVNGNGESACGILVGSGDVTINGGTVNATGGTASGSTGYSYGISALAGTVEISGGTVTATGGSALGTSGSCGIFARQAVSISGGTVTATGGTSSSGNSCGIYAYDVGGTSVTISGGTVTATGGNAFGSYGIWASSISGQPSVTINGGAVVTATGGEATGNAEIYGSYGINARLDSTVSTAGTVTIAGSTVNATGGTAKNGNSYGVYAETSVSVTGSTVKAGSEGENGEGIATAGSPESTEYENSIIFNNGEGTVYGNATLPGDLTIEQDETLTIPDGTSLTVPESVTLTNNGTVTNNGTIDSYGTITGNPITDVNQKVTGVSLNTNTLTLEVGGTGTLTATITPDNATNQNVTWSSDDETVATVENGLVTAVSAGTATITVTTKDGNKTATCAVTVTATTVPVSGVSLNKDSTSLYVGDTETLTATITPDNATNKNVTWSSDDTSVATVDTSGLVTAVGAGTATITVTTVDQSKTATCEVTVAAATVPVTGVTLSQNQVSLYYNRTPNTLTLTATVAPANATNKAVTWTSSNPSVATVENGVVTALACGTAVITATAADGSGASASCTVTVSSYLPPANPNYKITVEATQGGTVTADPTAAKAGTTVTLTPVPDRGYQVGSVAVTDRFGDAVAVTEQANGTYTFTMPNGQVTVTVTFAETPLPFTDVTEGDWFYDAVRYAYETGLMDGVGDSLFAPNSETTRAQLVTILYRLEGEPEVSGTSGFTDVEADIWYTDAVAWAAQNGIVNGVSDTEFAPGDDITREQLVTVLYRYAESKGYDVSASADLSGYPDAGQVQDYAQPAMAWAVAEGIVEGVDGNLNPAGNATRAQIATILMRFCEGIQP